MIHIISPVLSYRIIRQNIHFGWGRVALELSKSLTRNNFFVNLFMKIRINSEIINVQYGYFFSNSICEKALLVKPSN